ncbi:MAG: cell envelope integrity protein TolA [Oscillospiraceae bacterium]|nr:cell envelope integrity protein TolA [Oscillospiraceae bacterium]
MRCKFCGSKAIYPYTQHEQATAGRVVAGAIIAGAIGAAAGLAGKNVKGYRCSACGMFSEQPMDFGEEMLINSAVSDAKNGKTVIYERYQEKYANLEFVPVRQVVKQESALLPDEDYDEDDVELLPEAEPVDESIKHSYCPNQYVVGSPVFISNVTIKDDNGTDVLLLDINNISGKTLRSVYLNITVYDDVGDQISTSTFAYQGLSAATGEQLPQAKPFNLNTNVAYKVEVTCEKAAFTDDTVWRKEENPTIYSVPEKTELVPESFAQHKYLRVLLAKKGALRVGQKLYYPVVEETHRLCVCGNPAINGSKCLACSLSEADLQEVMDYDVLIQCRKDVIAKTAKERTEALRELCMQVQEDQYQKAIHLKEEDTQASCAAAIEIFASMEGYKDADNLCVACKDRIEELKVQAEIERKDHIYAAGKEKMSGRVVRVRDFEDAITEFEKIPGWKDADEQIIICQQKIKELEVKAEADRKERERKAEIARAEAVAAEQKRKKRNTILAICAAILALIGVFIYFLVTAIIPDNQYGAGLDLLAEGKFDEAYAIFESLGDYNDSAEQCKEVRYQQALSYWEKKEYEVSNPIFQELGAYKDSEQRIHTHEYATETITAPGCEAEGEEKLTCKTCPYSYNRPANATGHSYGEMQITKAPTCTETGEQKAVCAICGKAVTEPIAMIEHSYNGAITKAATCDIDGVKTFSCSCGDSYTEIIQATGHSYSDATCTEPKKCKTCGATSGAATGHNYAAATCSIPSTCTTCGGTTGTALGHSDNGKMRCSRCNANLTPVLSITLTGESKYMSPEYITWKHAADANYRMTVKVLEIIPNDKSVLGYQFEVNYDHHRLQRTSVKAGDTFTMEFHVYKHNEGKDQEISWKAQNCIIQVTIVPI